MAQLCHIRAKGGGVHSGMRPGKSPTIFLRALIIGTHVHLIVDVRGVNQVPCGDFVRL